MARARWWLFLWVFLLPAAPAHAADCDGGEPTEVCDRAWRIQIDATRLRLEDGAELDHPAGLRRRADGLMALWERHGAEPCAALRPRCEHFDAILYNAARFYDLAGAPFDAARVRRVLLDPGYHLDWTAPAVRTRVDLFRFARRITRYAEAIDHGRALVTRHPKLEDSPGILAETLALQLALGDATAAAESLAELQRFYTRTRASLVTKATLDVGHALIEAGELRPAQRILSRSALRLIDRHGTPSEQLEAQRLKARIASSSGMTSRATEAYDRLLTMAEGLDGDRPPSELGARVVDAIAEALAFRADQRRAAALARIAKGPTSGDAKAWSQKVAVALDEAEQAYRRLEEADPSPRWLVHASERTASMHHAYAERLGAAIGRAGGDALGGARAEASAEAVRGYAHCRQIAVETQQLDEVARRCLTQRDELAGHKTAPLLGPGWRGGSGAMLRPAAPLTDPRATRRSREGSRPPM